MYSAQIEKPSIRCKNCNKLLARGILDLGEIEIQCPRCKTRNTLRASRPNTAPHDGLFGDNHVVCSSYPDPE